MTATEAIFTDNARATLRAAYPETPALLDHRLSEHPLLTNAALADLARAMRPEDVEYNRGDLPVGINPADVPANGLGILETLENIETNGSWMVLKFIEQVPAYRDLLHETLAEIEPIVRDITGEMIDLQGFIFLSSPGAVTPYHMDPEHNILLQVRGSKTMTVFPADDEELAPSQAHEAFHEGGHRNLEWRDNFAARGMAHALPAGKAIYVPVKAPHWVKNGPAASLSLSITWRSEWVYREKYARSLNATLRRLGLNPAPPKRFPHQNHMKSLAWRAMAKAQRALGRN
ncbi:transcriptional regulator [Parasphingopyxis sp.]|uniref:transcriptional regulator n=1 Tax=Parasphingopyxis sp. TaxID=1920299 RepID=UPI00261D19FD|nr:transcriptional regulator [Parasphingopyxis sp.]